MLDQRPQEGDLGQQTGQTQPQTVPAASVAGSQPPILPAAHFNPPDWADDTGITNPNIQGYGG